MTIAEDFVAHHKTTSPGQCTIYRYLHILSVCVCVCVCVQRYQGPHYDWNSHPLLEEEARIVPVSMRTCFLCVCTSVSLSLNFVISVVLKVAPYLML